MVKISERIYNSIESILLNVEIGSYEKYIIYIRKILNAVKYFLRNIIKNCGQNFRENNFDRVYSNIIL